MNTDVRVDVTLPGHRKFKRLRRSIGPAAMEHLICFWVQVALQKPNGVLAGWTVEDIADAAGWKGGAGRFAEAMVDAGFLDQLGQNYAVHEWHIHQPWACKADDRKASASTAGKASAAARKAKTGSAQPSRTTPERLPNDSFEERATDSERLGNDSRTQRTPVPLPSPLPIPKPKTSCSEPSGSSHADPPAITLPTNRKGEEFHVSVESVDELRELYPAVNVEQALRSMRGWLLANPGKRKTAQGMPRFINAWLAKEQDRGPRPVGVGSGGASYSAYDAIPDVDIPA